MSIAHQQKVLNGFGVNKQIFFIVRRADKTNIMQFDEKFINSCNN
jgi:hypothetical protein